MYKYFYRTVFLTIIIFCPVTSFAQSQLAFPGAEGYGKYTVGGRGGAVYEVTNLNASGPGSFAAAVAASGARTVVFRVAGTIDANVDIKNGNITIAGQTAPGDGICIKGELGIKADNVIIRYIRVRTDKSGDTMGGRYNDNIIIDHVSASWSSDEVMSIYHGNNVTIQWCMITEACGGSHAFGGIWGNNHSTYHHNLFAHNVARNPRIASGAGYNDVRNNVIYNWKNESVYGGEAHQGSDSRFQFCSTNVVANYFKPGPGTESQHMTRICSPWSRNGAADYGDWYVADNYLVGSPEVTADNWKGVFPQYTGNIPVDLAAIPGLKLDTPSEFIPINQQSAEDAYLAVLDHAGCSLPNRDVIDTRIIEEVRNGTAAKGSNGFVSSPSAAGGWPALQSGPAPVDSDHDGMPDEWEIKNNLNPNNAADRNNVAADGYTMLEKYLNSLVTLTLGSNVIHVDDDALNDPGPYDSQLSDPLEDGTEEHPFDSIQEAIEAADERGIVRVNEGTYLETIDFLGKNIKVSGLNPYVSPAKAFPVIDADYMGTIVTFAQEEDSDCELSGFVLTRGSGVNAGAILCDGASPRISHCLIVGNRCDDPDSGALYCRNSDSIFDHCTISGNYGGLEGAAIRFVDSNVVISNSIVTGNLPEQIIVEYGNEPLIRYSNIEGLLPGGVGNIDADPNFIMEGQWINVTEPDGIWIDGDYHLASRSGHWDSVLMGWVIDPFTSPCVDAGDPAVSFAAEPEPNGERVNIGAYGGTNQASRRLSNTNPRPR